jgi:hypothetical protein
MAKRTATVTTQPKVRGRPFAAGQDSRRNNEGRPRGARCRATIAAETLLDGETEKLTRKAIDLALDGDTVALRLCLDRILPPARSRPISINIPPIKTAADLMPALDFVTQALGAGELSVDEASAIAALLETHRRTLELVDLEARVAALETGRGRSDAQ